MSDRTHELANRRLRLRAQCAQQRRQFASAADVVERQLHGVDQGIRILRRFASAPVYAGLAVAVIAFVKPRRLLRWVGQAMLLASAFKRLTRS